MEASLSLDSATCIRCGKCVRVCPSVVLTQAAAGTEVTLTAPEDCIACGHCVAVCPTGAVRHRDFPTSSIHPIDYTQLPSPEQVMLLCKARRSNRAIVSKAVPPELLEQILEAAHRAPTASNAQQVDFTLVTDPAQVQQIGAFTSDLFRNALQKLQNPWLKPLLKRLKPELYRYVPTCERLLREEQAGHSPILRHATALLFIHTPASNRCGAMDCNLAYQNGSLMATALGVSQVYMGFILMALGMDRKKRLARKLGIAGNIHAVMALGMPEFRFPNYIDRKPITVDRR